MSALSYRVPGMAVVALGFVVGCSSAKKIDVGGTCTLNSDCTSPLTCSMGKCHEGCRASTDCQPGQVCTKVGGVGVCQLPAEVECKEKPCGGLLICGPDLHCRSACQSATNDCMEGQVCVQTLCADKAELDVTTGQLPQKVIADGGLDAQSTSPEAGRADTARSPDVTPASPDLGRLSPDTAIVSPDTAIMSSLPDALPADTRLFTDGSLFTPDLTSALPPSVDASFASFEVSMPDVPYTGPCGMSGMPCCAGDSCTDSSSSCVARADGTKTCWNCGMIESPCCPGDTCTNPQTECKLAPDGGIWSGKTCQMCGGAGQTCCSGNKCTDNMAICESGTCCGVAGGPCCAGDLCTSSNQICTLPPSGSGTTKTCQSCGMSGEQCCAGKKCQMMGTVCSDSSQTCVQCGGQNQPCCSVPAPAPACTGSALTCSAGICTCTPPPAPVVTATPGNGQVVLTWTGTPGPDGGNSATYTVSRSVTAGSRYSFLGPSSNPTYTDTGVSNGVTYYYVVSANLDGCASADSAEVSAKPMP